MDNPRWWVVVWFVDYVGFIARASAGITEEPSEKRLFPDLESALELFSEVSPDFIEEPIQIRFVSEAFHDSHTEEV